MYRAYEDPRQLEEELKVAEEELERAVREDGYEPDEFDEERIASLKERINFAWQDEEYDEDCRREAIRLGEIDPEEI